MKKNKEDLSFRSIEGEIHKLEVDMGVGAFSSEWDDHLKDIMHQKQLILTHKEEYLLQKSQGIWLHAGDENTKYFQNFEN